MDLFNKIKTIVQTLTIWVKFSTSLIINLPFIIVGIYLHILRMVHRLFIIQTESSLLDEIALLIRPGNSVMGKELSMRLMDSNAKVVVIDTAMTNTHELLVQKMRESGQHAYFYECNFKDINSIRQTLDSIEKDVGHITMVFHGNLLMERASEKDMMASYNILIDQILPRMQGIKMGHLIFLSMINSSSDFHHLRYVHNILDWLHNEVRSMKGTTINLTSVDVHKSVLEEGSDYTKYGIFGSVAGSELASTIVIGVKRKQSSITMPAYMLFVPRYLELLPTEPKENLLEILYRVY